VVVLLAVNLSGTTDGEGPAPDAITGLESVRGELRGLPQKGNGSVLPS